MIFLPSAVVAVPLTSEFRVLCTRGVAASSRIPRSRCARGCSHADGVRLLIYRASVVSVINSTHAPLAGRTRSRACFRCGARVRVQEAAPCRRERAQRRGGVRVLVCAPQQRSDASQLLLFPGLFHPRPAQQQRSSSSPSPNTQ